MSKPVDKKEFWKDRIDYAKKNNKMHYSVFLTQDEAWKDIEMKHRAIFKEIITPNMSVIDLGCGYGRASEMLECKRYVGVDFSEDFIKEANRLYPDEMFLSVDLKKLPFKDKEFDVGFMISVKAMIQTQLGEEEWKLIEKECKRICKKLLILEYGGGDAGILNDADHYEII